MVKIQWKMYALAFFITSFIFITGISFGLFLNKEKIDILQRSLQNLQIQQEDEELQFILTMEKKNENPCDVISKRLNETIDTADRLGKKVAYYEENERVKDPDYFPLKKQYTLTLIRYWLFWERMKLECNQTVNTILYFYSNVDCTTCPQQATVLSYLKQEYPYEIVVFALDSDIDLNTVKLLKTIYNITEIPTLIINGKAYGSLQNLDKVKAILDIK